MKKNIILFSFFLYCSIIFADSPGTTGFQFLKMDASARSSAMAGAFVAISNDVNVLHYNPAGIALVDQRTGSASYVNHLLDFNSGYMAVVLPKIGPGNFGFSALYMDYGNFTKTDTEAQELGEFGANSVSLAGSYAAVIYPNLYAGASAKYVHFTIDNFSSDALAIDAGVQYYIPSQLLTLGVAVNNLGQAVTAFIEKKDPLPTGMRVGLAKRLAHLPLLLGVNAYKYKSERWQAAIGGEFTLSENLFLRLGYDLLGRDLNTNIGTSKETFAGTAIGLGLNVNNIHVDYSFTSFGEIGSLNRFTISSQF